MMNIVVIDDESAIRDFVRQILERNGHEVASFEDGRTAVTYIVKEKVDLVISDVNLPKPFDGIGLRRNILAQKPGLPFIFISGDDETEIREKIEPLGGPVIVLCKPFRAKTLIAAINEAIKEWLQ